MSPQLFHLYGPFAINSYGACIAAGVLLFLWLIKRDKRLEKIIDIETFNTVVSTAIIAGILGGRFLFIAEEWQSLSWIDMLSFWQGGFSILGTVLAIALVSPLQLYYLRTPILPFADLVATYTPLMQAIARLGCFFAGCCYGLPTTASWGITYTDPNAMAPCFMPLHPTQLYSSLALLCIFCALYAYGRTPRTPGTLLCLYFIGIGTERFVVDFWRADRTFSTMPFFATLSIHQWIASGIVICACGALAYLFYKPKTYNVLGLK